MNFRLLIQVLTLTLATSLPLLSFAQIDVTQVTADTKTYLFSDGKTNVKNYIVEQLQKQTTCCGDEKLYLEVRIDPSGYVKEVKALTGKGECYKKSAIDIVKNIKWNNAGMTGPKTVYFEITPNVGCEGRANTYTAIAVTNNPLYAGATTTPAPAPEPAPEARQAQPVTPPATQPAAPVVATTQPATPPATQPAPPQVVPTATTQPAQPQVQPQQPSFTATLPPQNQPAAARQTPPANGQTAEQRLAEIQQLQRQLNEMKAAEEARNQIIAENTRLKQEAERKRKEEEERKKKEEADRKAAADAAMAARNAPPAATTPGTKPGTPPAPAKPKEDPYGNDGPKERSYDIVEETPQNRPGGKPGEKPAAAEPEVDPNQAKLLALQKQMADLDARNKATQMQHTKAEQDRATIAAEIEKTQRAIREVEEAEARKAEQAELDRIAAAKKEAEQKQVEFQASVERIQKEMQLLQEEIQKKMADIERYKQEADTQEQLRVQKEQQIMLERAKREQGILSSAQPGIIAPTLAPIPLPKDTSKIGLLLYQVNVLTQQVNALQNMIVRQQGGGASFQATTSTPGNRGIQPAPTQAGQNTPSANGTIKPAAAVRTAADDQSWRKVDFATARTPEDGKASREAIEAGIKANRELTGAAADGMTSGRQMAPARNNVVASPTNQAHDDIHVNTAGPALNRPEYEDGEQGMKDYIRGQLRLNGVCGLAQAAFEVTVNPKGDVVSYRVLAANTPQVYSLMPGILTSLKFKQTNGRFNQNSYLEFKTEIRCDEKPSTGELENTPNYIEVPATSK